MRHARGLREALFLAALVLITVAIAILVQRAGAAKAAGAAQTLDSLSWQWERAFKKQVVKYLAYDDNVVSDERVCEAVELIRERLWTHAGDSIRQPEILVVDARVPNALTFPGGLILVFTPLIRLTDSPEEFAAVIAHELGHVVKRDPVKRMARQYGVSVLLASVGGGQSAGVIEDMLSRYSDAWFTREQEDAADAFACALLDSSGIDPIHFARFLEKLAPDSARAAAGPGRHFMTHPDMHSRIEQARIASKRFSRRPRPIEIDWALVKRALPSVFDR